MKCIAGDWLYKVSELEAAGLWPFENSKVESVSGKWDESNHTAPTK